LLGQRTIDNRNHKLTISKVPTKVKSREWCLELRWRGRYHVWQRGWITI